MPSACCVTNAPALRAAVEIMLDQDANALIFGCPGTPFGDDDGGNVPPDSSTGKCEDDVAKAVAKFAVSVAKCHLKAADSGLKGMPFDEGLCESNPATGKGAKEKYDAAVAKLSVRCPSCSTANAAALRS